MRHIVDYTVKFVLLFFILARFVSGPAPQAPVNATNPSQEEPSSDSKADVTA